MKTFGFALTALLLNTPALALATNEFDRCTDAKTVALNSWILTVNDADTAARADVLGTLRLLATGGFSIANVFAFKEADLAIVVSFDPTYWSDAVKSKAVKNETLEALSGLKGNLLRCNLLAFPTPAIGVRE